MLCPRTCFTRSGDLMDPGSIGEIGCDGACRVHTGVRTTPRVHSCTWISLWVCCACCVCVCVCVCVNAGAPSSVNGRSLHVRIQMINTHVPLHPLTHNGPHRETLKLPSGKIRGRSRTWVSGPNRPGPVSTFLGQPWEKDSSPGKRACHTPPCP